MGGIIIEDTRNQPGKHENIRRYCDRNEIRIVRSKLVVGDYSLPTSSEVCVDTKYGLQEVYGNLVQAHDRFARECDLAHELGIRLVVLVEEDGIPDVHHVHEWRNPRYDRYITLMCGHESGRYLKTKLPEKKPIDSPRLERMMLTFAEHHHCEWRFCDKAKTGEVLMEILTNGIQSNTDAQPARLL